MLTPNGAGTRRDALVIVAKYPSAGLVKTRLGATIGHDAAASLYRAFLADLVRRFGSTGDQPDYDLYWACVPGIGSMQECLGTNARIFWQRGANFAERLYHIAEDLHARAYTHIIIMSSDSPHLPAWYVSEAFHLIAPGMVVLGPAEDGGYYLIGLDSTWGVPDLFRGIEMSTPNVLAETLARVRTLELSAAMLPSTFDVDNVNDLARLAELLAGPRGIDCPHTAALLNQLYRLTLVRGEAHDV